jgi:hypothetical protein
MLYVLVGLVGLLSLVSAVVNIWSKLRPEPPYAQQFAARQHFHEQYVTAEQIKDIQFNCHGERVRMMAASRESEGDVIHRLEALRRDITDGLSTITREAEERASKLHKRIDPLVGELAATSRAVANHLEDHRKGKGA